MWSKVATANIAFGFFPNSIELPRYKVFFLQDLDIQIFLRSYPSKIIHDRLYENRTSLLQINQNVFHDL